MEIIKTTELPIDIQALLADQGFRCRTVRVEPCVDFTCPTSYCDYNIMTLIGYNQKTGEHTAVKSGHYECHMNWTPTEIALYKGTLKTKIPDTSMWFIVLDTYPEPGRATIFCHPDAISKRLTTKVELTHKQEVALFLARSITASYRLEEARRFKIGKAEWGTLKAELYGLKLMTATGGLTILGKNRAKDLNFYSWEEK